PVGVDPPVGTAEGHDDFVGGRIAPDIGTEAAGWRPSFCESVSITQPREAILISFAAFGVYALYESSARSSCFETICFSLKCGRRLLLLLRPIGCALEHARCEIDAQLVLITQPGG